MEVLPEKVEIAASPSVESAVWCSPATDHFPESPSMIQVVKMSIHVAMLQSWRLQSMHAAHLSVVKTNRLERIGEQLSDDPTPRPSKAIDNRIGHCEELNLRSI